MHILLQLGLDAEDAEMVVADATNAAKTSKKKLDLVKWVAAYQCFALASDAAEVRVSCILHYVAAIVCRCAGLAVHGGYGSLPELPGSGRRCRCRKETIHAGYHLR